MMELKIVLAMLAGSFGLRLAGANEVEVDPRITLRPKNGMRMTLTPRGT